MRVLVELEKGTTQCSHTHTHTHIPVIFFYLQPRAVQSSALPPQEASCRCWRCGDQDRRRKAEFIYKSHSKKKYGRQFGVTFCAFFFFFLSLFLFACQKLIGDFWLFFTGCASACVYLCALCVLLLQKVRAKARQMAADGRGWRKVLGKRKKKKKTLEIYTTATRPPARTLCSPACKNNTVCSEPSYRDAK